MPDRETCVEEKAPILLLFCRRVYEYWLDICPSRVTLVMMDCFRSGLTSKYLV